MCGRFTVTVVLQGNKDKHCVILEDDNTSNWNLCVSKIKYKVFFVVLKMQNYINDREFTAGNVYLFTLFGTWR